MTVSGPIPPDKLGFTLPHEHTGIALWHIDKRWDYWELTPDDDLITEELRDFRRRGGATLVDLTLDGVGRDPHRLRRLASATGLNIVMGSGWYRGAHYPVEARIDRRSVDDLAAEIVREFADGVGDTGIRPGIIGELGTSEPVHPSEEKVLRAAVRAQEATGLAISVHLHPLARNGHDVLDILAGAGAPLDRVILGHVDLSLGHPDAGFDELVGYHKSLLARGAVVEYDTIGNELYWPDMRGGAFAFPSDRERARALAELLDAGYAGQIVVSQDVANKLQLRRYGGYGYASVLSDFPAFLRLAGVDERALATLTVENPSKLLSRR
jgi:phosphotriesterase-related protein